MTRSDFNDLATTFGELVGIVEDGAAEIRADGENTDILKRRSGSLVPTFRSFQFLVTGERAQPKLPI